jgi:hypothetical protein
MKKLFFLTAFIFPVMLFAQSVGINADASQPDNTAILDIKSNTKGLLIPRLTTLQRTSIAGPALGLTVFDLDTYSFWMYRGDLMGGWAELLHSFNKHWDRTGTNIFTTNPGNVGIGTNSPTEKLTINGPDAAISFMNSGSAKGYVQTSGSNMRIGTYANNTTGNMVFATKAVDRMWIDETGKVGIGTSTPSSALTIDGSNPWIEMRNAGVYKGFLWASGNDIKVGTSSGNTTGKLILQTKLVNRMTIDENGYIAVAGSMGIGANTTIAGNVGIGTTNTSSELTINGVDPTLQLKNDNVDKGFVQLVDDDIRIGTNLTNDLGMFIVRTNGSDRMSVNGEGKVTIAAPGGQYNMLCIGENSVGVAGIDFKAGGNFTRGYLSFGVDHGSIIQYGGKFSISTSGVGMSWLSNGNLVMGANDGATGYKLSVNGKVIGTEFTTMAYNNWPDYVFADDYKLKPLSDVKKFIAVNKHLPNIPAASEIEKNGIQLGDMSKRLMEKVEELTLYILQLQDQVDDLKKQMPPKKEN